MDYIGKPFDPRILKAKVGLHAEMYKKTKSLEMMEKQLEETASRFKLLFDSVPEAICAASFEGQVTFWNQAMEKYTDYKAEECLGKNLSDFFQLDEFLDFARGFKETLLTNRLPFG